MELVWNWMKWQWQEAALTNDLIWETGMQMAMQMMSYTVHNTLKKWCKGKSVVADGKWAWGWLMNVEYDVDADANDDYDIASHDDMSR